MRILVFTQNEFLFLPGALDYFLHRLGREHSVVGAVVLEGSPFGKKLNPFQKVVQTLKVFGPAFLLRYGILICMRAIAGQSVRAVFKSHQIPVCRLKVSVNSDEGLRALRKYDADLFVSITANEIFKQKMLSIPQYGTLNLHSALLPKYRGLMPSFWVIKNKEEETGVSVFLVDEGVDSGPIVVQKRLQIKGSSQWALIRMTKLLGMEAILEAIQLIEVNGVKRLNLIENDNSKATYYSFPSRRDVVEFLNDGSKFF